MGQHSEKAHKYLKISYIQNYLKYIKPMELCLFLGIHPAKLFKRKSGDEDREEDQLLGFLHSFMFLVIDK